MILNLIGYEYSLLYKVKTGLIWFIFVMMIFYIYKRSGVKIKNRVLKAIVAFLGAFLIIFLISWVEYIIDIVID